MHRRLGRGKQACRQRKLASRQGSQCTGYAEGFHLIGDARLPRAAEIAGPRPHLPQDPRALHLTGVHLRVGEEEGKMCVGSSCGDVFFIVLVAAVEKMLPWRIRAAGKVVQLDGLDKLRMRWARWA
jgi:hypothetical protein